MSEEGKDVNAEAKEVTPNEIVGPTGERQDVDAKVKDERMWAMLTHLAGFAYFTGVPLMNVAGPVIIWQIKKDGMPSIEGHGKEATNFQISMSIYIYGLLSLGGIFFVTVIGIPVAFLLWIAAGIVFLAALIWTIIGGLKANDGELYRYPFTMRFLK